MFPGCRRRRSMSVRSTNRVNGRPPRWHAVRSCSPLFQVPGEDPPYVSRRRSAHWSGVAASNRLCHRLHRRQATLDQGNEALLPAGSLALETRQPDDVGSGRAGQEPRNIFEVHPAASGNFVARTGLRAIRDIAMENVMVLFLAFEFEEVSGRLARKLGLFLELAKRCGREVFAALEDASRQSPFRPTWQTSFTFPRPFSLSLTASNSRSTTSIGATKATRFLSTLCALSWGPGMTVGSKCSWLLA